MKDDIKVEPERMITIEFDGSVWTLTVQQAAKLRNDLNGLLAGPFLKAVSRAIDTSWCGGGPGKPWNGTHIPGGNPTP